jgi:hypothetical protein
MRPTPPRVLLIDQAGSDRLAESTPVAGLAAKIVLESVSASTTAAIAWWPEELRAKHVDRHKSEALRAAGM